MKLQLKRSNVLVSGEAKAPTASQLDYGELAVNYNAADPTIFLKDSSNSIVKVQNNDLQAVCDIGSTTTTGATFGGTVTGNLFSGPLPYSDLTGTPTIPSNNNQLTNGAGYVTSSGNTVIGTDSDLDTSGAEVVDQLNMTDGVITSHSKRTLTLANLGYTGATNANYITNNNQLTNGAGYLTSRNIPQNTQGSTYTLVAADVGKHILASGTVTIPNSVFSAGDAVTIVNNTSSDLTITKTITTMYMSSDGTSANRILAARGMATVLFASGTVAYISGAGLS